MNILVTGGAGFIGSHLAEQLLGRGDTVVCLDNFDDYYDPDFKRQNLAACLGSSQLRLAVADIRHEDDVNEVFAADGPFDAVVHLAALAGVRASVDRAQDYLSVNVLGTEKILAAAAAHGVPRVVFASSSTVYGEGNGPFREGDACGHPLSPYGASKAGAEALCHAYHHLHGLSIVCLRLFSVYGPRVRPDLAVYRFARAIEEGQPVPIYGDGSARRDFTFVDDVLDGFVAALEADIGFECINLGNTRPVPISELITLLEQALRRSAELDHQPTQAGDATTTCADISRARELLGYDPGVPLEEGIQVFSNWFRGHHADNRAAGGTA
jgi:UDP-glucuronate 4-epimerase